MPRCTNHSGPLFARWWSSNHQLSGQEIERHVPVDRLAAKPAGQLVEHQAGGDVGRVDRAGQSQFTPHQVWQSRARIDYTERARFHLAVERAQEEQRQKRSCGSEVQPTAAEQAAEHRRAVRQALVELGILTTVWRSITLPIKPRKVAKIS